ncbi:transglycosylase SLT domain-containing protein, partial [Halobacillus trueperi]|uniref:transglycosylase SLT domain-containing protein n=1 Tax=Halobacillus trueperi TaxID=156205 RepID=UPI002163D401
MKEQKPLWTTGIALLLVVAAFFTINQWNQKQEKALADQKQELKNKNEKLSKEIERLQSTNDYLKEQPSAAEEKNGYHTWPEIEKKADRLVKESEGNFKKSWAMYLVKEAERYKINPFLVYELLKVETGGTFDPELVGPETKYGHAYGMSQFMKNTAPWIADMAGLPYEEELLFDPYYSMQLSLVYLDFLQNKYDNWDEALTAYHRGMGGLNEYKEENGHA